MGCIALVRCVLAYQSNATHEITQQISSKLLKLDVLTFETYWAVNSEIIKQVTSSWSVFIQIPSVLHQHFTEACLIQHCQRFGNNRQKYFLTDKRHASMRHSDAMLSHPWQRLAVTSLCLISIIPAYSETGSLYNDNPNSLKNRWLWHYRSFFQTNGIVYYVSVKH